MSTPSASFGAPSLGPADKHPRLITPPDTSPYAPAWDDPAPAAWRAFGEPANTSKENHVPDHMSSPMGGGYGVEQPLGHDKPLQPQPAPEPAPQPEAEQQ